MAVESADGSINCHELQGLGSPINPPAGSDGLDRWRSKRGGFRCEINLSDSIVPRAVTGLCCDVTERALTVLCCATAQHGSGVSPRDKGVETLASRTARTETVDSSSGLLVNVSL